MKTLLRKFDEFCIWLWVQMEMQMFDVQKQIELEKARKQEAGRR